MKISPVCQAAHSITGQKHEGKKVGSPTKAPFFTWPTCLRPILGRCGTILEGLFRLTPGLSNELSPWTWNFFSDCK